MIPLEMKAGHMNMINGFHAAAAQEDGVSVRIKRHDGTPSGVRKCIRALVQGKPATGILVALPQFTVGAVTELINLGIRVGREVSLVGSDDEDTLGFVCPTVARYQINAPLLVRKLSRTVLALAQGGLSPHREVALMPQFIPGDTLGDRSDST